MASMFLSPLTFPLYPTSLVILHLVQDVSLPFTHQDPVKHRCLKVGHRWE
jgi:hypothetical protein